ncbi:hypothetical protein LZ32DRAFT_677290 [Colletotrichum eremochloae]|nr:hypothetical protein LZ32DRAFT_677290 [Colletotrichum eremochloae]
MPLLSTPFRVRYEPHHTLRPGPGPPFPPRVRLRPGYAGAILAEYPHSPFLPTPRIVPINADKRASFASAKATPPPSSPLHQRCPSWIVRVSLLGCLAALSKKEPRMSPLSSKHLTHLIFANHGRLRPNLLNEIVYGSLPNTVLPIQEHGKHHSDGDCKRHLHICTASLLPGPSPPSLGARLRVLTSPVSNNLWPLKAWYMAPALRNQQLDNDDGVSGSVKTSLYSCHIQRLREQVLLQRPTFNF